MGGAAGPVLALIIMHVGFGWDISVWAFWAYSAFRNIHEIDIHSGVGSMLFRYVPFWGTVEHHNRHHSHSRGNYASTFTYLDRLFGTTARG
jgi:methylsterol monooxygenase